MPLDLDIQESTSQIKLHTSKILELIASVHLLADKQHHAFAEDWVRLVMGRLSDDSLRFLNLISGMNFPGLDLYDFTLISDNFDDVDQFLKQALEYDALEFLYIVLNQEVGKDELSKLLSGQIALSDYEESLPWSVRGSRKALELLLYHTKTYQSAMVRLAKEIHALDFDARLTEHEEAYADAIASVKSRLEHKDPVTLAEEIKGAKFTSKRRFNRYIFVPSYFLHRHNIICYNETTFLLVYNINATEYQDSGKLDRISEALRILSDKTRLEILRQLKRRPTYGKVLASRLNLTTATISRHLDQLRSINLIREERSDNVKYFKVNDEEIEKLMAEINGFINTI